MRNLKKLLALTLAMVMAFSLMLSASAVDYKDYPDTDSITAEFDEAVRVLTGLKVFQGDEKGFRPGDTITRAEAAAIIYRIATQDVAGTQEKLYSDYGTFSDVNHDDWFAGYVGYCQNAGYIKGTTPTTFSPYLKVTGYEMLAMLLRVVGYGKTNEFTGPQWQVNVASLSKELGVINNVKSANFEHTLTMAARRDVVADLAFQTMILVPTVTYTPALSYNDKVSTIGSEFNPTLGQKNFGLYSYVPGADKDKNTAVVDEWGRPGYYWVKDGVKVGVNATTYKPVYQASATSAFAASKVVATIVETPAFTYTEEKRECDLAHDYNFAGDKEFELFVNDNTWLTEEYLVRATDTVTKVGGQGRLVEVYKKNANHEDRVVMIDTFLAKVTGVKDAVLDRNGHVIVPAQLTLGVYDMTKTAGNAAKQGINGTTMYTYTNKVGHPSVRTLDRDTNWEYSVGDMLLLNAYTDDTLPNGYDKNGAVNGNNDPTGAAQATIPNYNHDPKVDAGANAIEVTTEALREAARNKAAFEPNQVAKTLYVDGNPTDKDINCVILGKAESQIAKQTTTYWNQNKHAVGGTDVNDAMMLYLDEAGTNTTKDWAWYLDQYGNIIGIESVAAVNYGVITDIWSAFGQGDSSTDGTAKAIAKVKLADGSEVQYTIGSFLLSNTMTTATTANAEGHLDAGTATNALKTLKTTGVTRAGTETAADNTIRLVPKYDYEAGSGIMTAGEIKVWASAGSANASLTGELSVSPVASINKAADTNKTADKTYGVVIGNLFKFVTTDDGTMMAVEVAGDGTNSGAFAGLNNIQTSITAANNKLYKNLGYITVNNNAANGTIWLDDETKIMVYNPNTKKISTYNGVNELPSNLSITARANNVGEIDWAELDNDGRAEYLYVSGTFDGNVTYGLFYTNNGASQWDNSTKKGTIAGYFNGEAGTITFESKSLFDKVNNNKAYKGGLFALQITDGVVSNVMAETANETNLLQAATTTGTGKVLDDLNTALDIHVGAALSGTPCFKVGIAGNNPYTEDTEAVYYNDDNTGTNNGTANVSYNPTTRQVVVYGKDSGGADTGTSGTPLVYTVTANTKIVGQLDFLNNTDTVVWLNDVTIVYEPSNVNAITEIYITTLPTVTPGETGADTSLDLVRIYVDTDSSLRFHVTCASTQAANAADTATIYLKNTTTGSVVLNNETVTGVAAVQQNSAGDYTIIIPGAGGSLGNTAGQVYEGTISMTLADGTPVTYSISFTGRSIL